MKILSDYSKSTTFFTNNNLNLDTKKCFVGNYRNSTTHNDRWYNAFMDVSFTYIHHTHKIYCTSKSNTPIQYMLACVQKVSGVITKKTQHIYREHTYIWDWWAKFCTNKLENSLLTDSCISKLLLSVLRYIYIEV